VFAQIVDVFRDQCPAPIAGLPRRIQAAFRGRGRESDGRTHGGRFGWVTPRTIPTSSLPTNFSASSRPALRAMLPAAARADSPRRARDRNRHKDAFTPGRYNGMLLVLTLAHLIATLLGAAGESIGLDRLLRANTVKTRAHSLFRRGYEYLRGVIDRVLAPLRAAFFELVRGYARNAEIYADT
jgi:hypothetical protein